jgi:transposase-like protein
LSVVVGGVRVKLSDPMQMYLLVRAKMVEAALGAARLAIEAALVDEVNLRVGRARHEWRFLSQATRDDWHCPRCGSNSASDFSRDGRYARSLCLALGQIRELLVPRLECQVCGASVATSFAVIAKYRRFWYDLTEQALVEYGLSISLRKIAAKLGNALGGVSLSTLTSRIHAIERGIEEWKSRAIEDVPDVLQLDGIWFRRMVATGKKKRDSRGRLRAIKRRADRVVLVAVGIWSSSGRREILDWHIAESESEESYLHLLNRLYERGLTGEAGFKLVVHDGCGGAKAALAYGYADVLEQRCIFHKIKNVGENFYAEGTGSAREITADASHVFAGASKRSVRQRLYYFRKKWEHRQPKSVKSLLSDFELTLSYFDAGIDAVRFARTTSHQERANREMRRKFDSMGVVQSQAGERAAVHLAVLAYNCQSTGDDWIDTIRALCSSSLDRNTSQ